MTARMIGRVALAAFLVGASLIASGVTVAAQGPPIAHYQVTIENLTLGQPFSPPVAATHQKAIRMFQVGRLASAELEAIAEDGNQAPMANLFAASSKVTQVVDVGRPLTPSGSTAGGFSDTVSFEITAAPGDKFSVSTMLICTNDGFLGLDAVQLPQSGSEVHLLNGYDAGTEINTERSADIVDPCSALGPVPLAGDPNGNEDAAVDASPHEAILLHPNIQGGGDLSVSAHAWFDPVAQVTITRLDG